MGAVALGMSLAGPALGVAAADTSEPDSASVSADSSPAGAASPVAGGDLSDHTLAGVILREANLAGVHLSRSDLRGLDLIGANLTGVFWRNTTCPDGRKTDTGCSALPGVSAVMVDPVVVQLNSDVLESRVW